MLLLLPAELARSVVILPPGYSISGGRLVYNEEWDETAEVQSNSEVEDSYGGGIILSAYSLA